MTISLNGREAEIELDSNRDGSRFAMKGYWNDGEYPELTELEVDAINDSCNDQINAMWG